VGVRINQIVAAVCVLTCAGCGTTHASRETQHPQHLPVQVAPLAPPQPPEPTPEPTPYVNAGPELADLAGRFVRATLSYDSCAADRGVFSDEVVALATGSELRRLRASSRAHLRWWVLCQRNERAAVRIDGVSQEPTSGDARTLHLQALRTTRSDISTMRDFVEITLVVVRTHEGWRIDDADGGGL
jgi:hypothetical protein